jgi:hypothetical protein
VIRSLTEVHHQAEEDTNHDRRDLVVVPREEGGFEHWRWQAQIAGAFEVDLPPRKGAEEEERDRE